MAIDKAKRTGIFGAALNALKIGNSGIVLTDDGIGLQGRSPVALKFEDLSEEISVRKKLGFSSLSLAMHDGQVIHVGPLKTESAIAFASRANEARRAFYIRFLETGRSEIAELARVAARLENPRRYPSACLLQPFIDQVRRLGSRLLCSIPAQLINQDLEREIDLVRQLSDDPSGLRERAIKVFLARELESMSSFFDSIESNPLTPEQRQAVVTDEDATLVLAGAGSGKTSVITAKAAYLIQRGIRRPDEILLMAFARDAAEEMSERIQRRCGAAVDATTFHALGNAILREVEGQAPALAAQAGDEAQFRNLLRDILLNDVAKLPGLGKALAVWFGELLCPYRSEWDFKSMDEYFQYIDDHELRSLKGDRVRSFEELQIANWLFLNDIDYEYEPDYEHELPENSRTAYTPDFRLTGSGVYIEHFGVRRTTDPDGRELLTTAPYVDRDQYLKGMEWKRRVHSDHDTVLIETYSYERDEGRLTENLAKKLEPYASPKPIRDERVLETLAEQGQMDSFTRTLSAFLRHFKSGSHSIEACRRKGAESRDPARSAAFLKIFEPLFKAYQERLGNRIDFEDMILRAAGHVRAGRYKSPYRHLLVDEFQDISKARARLLLALKEQHEDARIFAVGDDWQSVFRFTGSDIHLMRNFGKTFGGNLDGRTGIHSSVDLGRTFRSVDRVALPARRFILKNPDQIEKRVVPAGAAGAPAIAIEFCSRNRGDNALSRALRRIQDLRPEGKTATVLLLGRYRHVQPANFRALSRDHAGLDLRFMTVHGSKGLEADHVIVLDASSGRMGFPSEVEDDPILALVLPESEIFDHAEERRLFYVALTRARYSVTILADRENPSSFARELADEEEYGVEVVGTAGIADRACGNCGGRMLAHAGKSGHSYFKCEHRFLCGRTLRSCNACGCDLPIAESTDPDRMKCSCGEVYLACPSCPDGWLVERSGRFGAFLGCVRFPECSGKAKHSHKSARNRPSPRR